MALKSWIGRAGAVPQVDTFTVGGTVAVGSTLTVTINTRAVTVTATAASATTAATELTAALGDSEYGEFAALTWTSAGAVVTGTGTADGGPFTATSTAGGSGSPTLTRAAVTVGTGPNYWSNANNWGPSGVPLAADDVVIGEGPAILYGLAQSAVTLATLTITRGFPATSSIGLPDRGDGDVAEYRATHLAVGATVGTVDTQSSLVRIDLGTVASAFTVHDTGRGGAGGFACDLLANKSTTTVVVNRGQVGVAANAGETSTVASVRVAFRERRASDATVEVGPGVTITSLFQTGGDVTLRSACPTITRDGGSLTRFGTGAVTTWNDDGGNSDDYGTGTITTLNSGGAWVRRGGAALTVTDCNLYGGGSTTDSGGVVVWTNGVVYVNCGPPAAPGDTENSPSSVHHFVIGSGKTVAVS